MNSFQHDTRVLKACSVSSEVAPEETVLVAALGNSGLPVEERINEQLLVWRPELTSRHWPRNLLVQLFKYAEWLWRVVKRAKADRPAMIHVHSLSALPVGVASKWITGAPVLYDAHELETEVIGASKVEKTLSRWAERFLIRWVDETVTVCDSIANWYVDAYSIDSPFIVRNIPDWREAMPHETNVFRVAHGIPEQDLIFLYQGALSPGRGIERLLELFDDRLSGKHLVLMGYGILESAIRDRASQSGNVHFSPAVSPDMLLQYTASADVGVCLIEPVCLSNYYSLPNKLFEYLKSGLPTIVNDLPEQRAIIEKYDCGWVVSDLEDSPSELLNLLDRDSIEAKSAGVLAASHDLSWGAESEVLKGAYAAIQRSPLRR